MKLSGKVAMVTGGSSEMNATACLALAAEGASIAMTWFHLAVKAGQVTNG